MGYACSCLAMSLKGRRFSLDSSIYVDGVGVLGLRRNSVSNKFGSKKSRQSLDETRLSIHEFSQRLNAAPREKAIEEEQHEQPYEANTHSIQKQNKTFHKLFQEIPEGENLTDTFSCALQKEVLYHGKLYVTESHVCFHSSVLLKDTRVVIPAASVTEVKKHNSALSMLSIQVGDGEKFSFASLRNRELCYQLLQSVCSHAKAGSQNCSPNVSSADNEADHDAVDSYSSLDDSVEHDLRRRIDFDRDGRSSLRASSDSIPGAVGGSSSPASSVITNENDQALSWIWRLTKTLDSFFALGEMRNFSVLFYIYFILIVLLLVVSGYIGLKIVALEEQLNSLGALTELSLHRREYHET